MFLAYPTLTCMNYLQGSDLRHLSSYVGEYSLSFGVI